MKPDKTAGTADDRDGLKAGELGSDGDLAAEDGRKQDGVSVLVLNPIDLAARRTLWTAYPTELVFQLDFIAP